MAYLIIPVVCFVLLAGLVWAFSLLPITEKTRKSRISDLDVILSVLMTAKGNEPYLLMKVPGCVTWLKATFPGSAVKLEVPLAPRLQQSRNERYLAILRDIGLDARIYLQLIPTTVLSTVAIAEVLAVSLGLSRLSLPNLRGEELTRPERLFLSFAILATFVGATVANEVLRVNVTLDTWVWFFAFVRIELLFGFLTGALPFIFYQVTRDRAEEEDWDLRGETERRGESE